MSMKNSQSSRATMIVDCNACATITHHTSNGFTQCFFSSSVQSIACSHKCVSTELTKSAVAKKKNETIDHRNMAKKKVNLFLLLNEGSCHL